MKFRLMCLWCLFALSGCNESGEPVSLDKLSFIKEDFISSVFKENFDESPFHIHYTFRTVFFSEELISFFGDLKVYDHLPHGWGRYEGKTFCKIKGQFKQITLDDLFKTPTQKEFLRSYCEDNLKHKNEQSDCTYFTGEDPLDTTLDYDNIHTFVVDDRFLIIIFQPYTVGGCGDGPFVVKIPYEDLKHQWNATNPLIPILANVIASQSYTSSWSEP